MEIGEANADGHGPTGQRFGSKPGTDPVGEMTQRRSVNTLFGGLLANGRLCSRRSRPTMRLNFTPIAIPRQRCELLSRRGTEQLLERPGGHLRQLPDSKHADLG